KEWAKTSEFIERIWAFGEATLSGFVYEDNVLELWSSMWVYADTVPEVVRLLSVAGLVQVVQAESLSELRFSHTPVVHPEIGSRPEPDELLGTFAQVPESREAVGKILEGEVSDVVRVLRRSGVFAMGNGGLTAEFPVGPRGGPVLLGGESDLLTVKLAEHTTLGAGVHMTLQTRRRPALGGRPLDPWELNSLEHRAACKAHFLGSWHRNPLNQGSPGLQFGTFVPGFVWRRGMLLNLVLSMGVRSKWLAGLR
ncbi:MAG: hypothetical protein RMM30_00750, partial [Armatimonadota bacterium]|nr:hypothetical protein [Armatimonadota bacterium]MDW8155106.1 hypothetical protein [Armatimonadota bacterium]